MTARPGLRPAARVLPLLLALPAAAACGGPAAPPGPGCHTPPRGQPHAAASPFTGQTPPAAPYDGRLLIGANQLGQTVPAVPVGTTVVVNLPPTSWRTPVTDSPSVLTWVDACGSRSTFVAKAAGRADVTAPGAGTCRSEEVPCIGLYRVTVLVM